MVLTGGRYEYFQQAVRRFPRRELLTLTASVASELAATNEHALVISGKTTPVTQYALAAVAKEAVLRGNEHRAQVASIRDLQRICDRFHNATESLDPKDPHFLSTLMVQTSFEQFPWQHSDFEELARSHALYVDAAISMGSTIIDEAFWRGVLGCSIPEYFGAVFVWFTGASKHQGRIDPDWIQQDNFAPVRDTVDVDVIDMVRRQLTATREEIRAIDSAVPRLGRRLRRYDFNPLQARPIVQLADDDTVAPQPLFVLRKATASGLFYDAIESAGKEFADELGRVFEHYVGMNLRVAPGLDVYDEILFDSEHKRSVDYFVDTGETLVLVEVKSTRLSAEARAAGPRLVDDLQRALGKAFRQISRSTECIRDSHPAFAHIPRRPRMAGLVVTLEPYFMGHVPDIMQFVGSDPGVPTVVAAARELEHLVAVGQQVSVGPLLDALFTTPPDEFGVLPQLGRFIQGKQYGRNPILERAWAAYPWGPETAHE